MKEFELSKLCEIIGGTLTGDGSKVIRGIGPLEHAESDEISFLANANYRKFMDSSTAAAVIVSEDYSGPGESLIRSADPYFAFRQAMVEIYGFRKPEFSGIDERTNIDPSAKLAESVSIGAFVTICAGCEIGSGTTIYPGAYIGPNCRIGKDCLIFPNVSLYDDTILGDRVTIHASSSIGHDGFGYATHNGKHEKIPTPGHVEIEDDVEIGAACTIDRAALRKTLIGAGTKFSNLIAIGHGTQMGKHCLVVAQTGLAGSVKVGNYCTFAGHVAVVGHIHVGDGVRVGAQAGVARDVPPGLELLGSPAIDLMDAKKAMVAFPKLPKLLKTVKRLEKEIAELKNRLDADADTSEEK